MASGTRAALIEAATHLLDEGGVEAVTLREVGHRVGVSHNAPYKHFPSKEMLLAAVAARELATRAAALAATGDGEPQAALRAALRDYIAWARDRPARFRLVFGPWSIESEELAAAAEHAQATLVALVVAAQRSGALPQGDPIRLASLLRALAHGAAELAAAGHLDAEGNGKGHASPDDLVDDLLRYLRTTAAG